MDFEDIHPMAAFLALLGSGITIFMMKVAGADIGFIWKILTPIATFFACFFLAQKMFT